jgi:MYXO-CTERM domain-containing protein
MTRSTIVALAASVLLCGPRAADAFCGFYVAGNDALLVNDATQVVLVRHGTRTVLSMQNNYQGPPEAFAMVVPVPVVLQENDVKTLPKKVLDDVERMGAPRLVEYWEQDPCWRPDPRDHGVVMMASAPLPDEAGGGSDRRELGVKIEAQFVVGEYEIVILSAKDSTGLDTWLRRENYNIPAGAEPLLRPYVEGGMKFFVAKVDPSKVKFVDGRAELSPLRFHYDSEQFNLPIRLGLANSSGTQDLIVNILAPGQRYEVANYKNITIPTNLDVRDEVRDRFGAFYAALFDATLAKHPGSVVTEYAWQASTCDPCPGPALGLDDFMTLGADVLEERGESGNDPHAGRTSVAAQMNIAAQMNVAAQMVLTRLHARYGKDITNDLEFKAAPPIAGGREHIVDAQRHKLEEGAQPSSVNNFQGRYAIRHPWTGPIKCVDPIRNRWGGPPRGGNEPIKPALDLAFAPRGDVDLAKEVRQDVPELGIKALITTATMTSTKRGCGCASSGGTGGLVALALLGVVWRRRTR